MDVIKVVEVPGLYYMDNIIDNYEEIITYLDEQKWEPITKYTNSRMVQHYGYKYNYSNKSIKEPTTPIPHLLSSELVEQLIDICQQFSLIDNTYEFNQCIVNNYNPGQGISKHFDKITFGNVIGCFTLLGGATMIFRNRNNNKDTYSIYTKPNSLYIMSGDSRYKWTHEMPSTKSDKVNNTIIKRSRRVSITFRNVPCFIF